MQAKYNEATVNRPKGDRVIDAPFVQIDVEKYSRQLKKEPAWEKSDRNSITVFKTVGFTMVIMRLHKDASMNNSVDGLLTIQVLEGSIECMVGSKSTTVDKREEHRKLNNEFRMTIGTSASANSTMKDIVKYFTVHTVDFIKFTFVINNI
jgi:hypothetical protein